MIESILEFVSALLADVLTELSPGVFPLVRRGPRSKKLRVERPAWLDADLAEREEPTRF
ncbi:MAG: hypothetical protein AAF411_04840 [Myxococcota bacterium]